MSESKIAGSKMAGSKVTESKMAKHKIAEAKMALNTFLGHKLSDTIRPKKIWQKNLEPFFLASINWFNVDQTITT